MFRRQWVWHRVAGLRYFTTVRRPLPASIIRCRARGSIAWSTPLLAPSCQIAYKTNAASFESEVIQSQQAICLVYYRPDSSGCNAYLAHTERLVDKLNEETTGAVSDTKAADTPSQRAWLKLCTINADENRNLASAFSVERAKLPVTYFIMQGTIIDKVVGQVAEPRLEGILRKFLEHYQKQMNVDLIAESPEKQNPLPAAATTDLLSGASTQYLQNRIMAALVGPECIRLPQESEKLDGLRKTIQQAKKKSICELQELRRELGVDVRRLSDEDMAARYFKSSQYIGAALLSGLEALFLARVHATIGNIAAENIVYALNAIQRDFEPALGDTNMRRLVSLCEVLLLRAKLLLQQKQGSASSLSAVDTSEEVPCENVYLPKMLRWIDEVVDARIPPEQYPTSDVEEMFVLLKTSLTHARRRENKEDENNAHARRVQEVKTCLLGVLQLYHSDPKSQEARLRLTSLLY
ncbi:hypothetical protein ERJ75_000876900 [Trypanosoma vivax]|nr:hypothetical protein ERJ75_000876900 [Trypanosoma vivax]